MLLYGPISSSINENNTTCVQCLFALVLHYQTTLIFNLCAIMCELDTLHPQLLKILNLSCNLQQLHYGTIHVLA